MSEEYVAAVRRSLEGWNRDDFDACVEMAHPDLEWISEVAQQLEGQELVYRGLDEFRRYWDEWHEIWSVRIEVLEIADMARRVRSYIDPDRARAAVELPTRAS